MFLCVSHLKLFGLPVLHGRPDLKSFQYSQWKDQPTSVLTL